MLKPSQTGHMLDHRFAAGVTRPSDLLAPLTELSEESATLIRGYGGRQGVSRNDLIPYFHVCGTTSNEPTLHVLVIGGWNGTEIASTYAVARFVAAVEERLHLVSGMEITAYPLANPAAFRNPTEPTHPGQLWHGHATDRLSVHVLEQELWRYDYDFVINLRHAALASEYQVDVWPDRNEQRRVLSDSLKRLGQVSPNLNWTIHPRSARKARTFTPVPDRAKQPAEIRITLAGADDPAALVENSLGLLLTLLHAGRQARAEGLL